MKRLTAILYCALFSLAGCRGEATPEDYQVWGIDVSRHQKSVDWAEVSRSDKPDFVFVKATEGTLIVDPTYKKHAKGLNDQGILWGAYHFFGHRTSGKEQARSFIKTAKLKKGNLIPVLDIEPHRFMRDPARSVREAKAFCNEIKRYYGVNPIIYTSTHFYQRYLAKDFREGDYTLWIADYRGNPSQLKWNFWQHTDCHSVSGISGGVDRNVFSGCREDLQRLVLQ